jgi:2-methylcitrate dehydratase PrpD
MQGAVQPAEPVLDAFVDWALRLRWDAVPEHTRAMVRSELLDYLGAAIAGRAVAGVPAWLKVLIDIGGRPDAEIIGGPRAPAHLAALCNGYYGHVLEFDDTHDEAVLHAGSAASPAALAAAGLRGGVSGRELCEAVLLGIEITCRLGVATRLNLVKGGWIYTALFGHFGATLAATTLLDRRRAIIKHAFGIVYCLASGNHQSTREGATTKHVQPGFAASNALLAAQMAAAGLDGVQQPLTGEDGLARVYLHGEFDAARATANLGIQFEFDRLSFKPYPTCRLTHPAISAALRLRATLGAAVNQVERLELIIGPQAHDVVARTTTARLTPQTRVAAQFSVHWAVAATLAHGELTPRQLLEEIPPSPRVQALIARITCTADAAAAQRDVGGCTLRAHGAFGTREVNETHAKGHPDNPLSAQELRAKFNANVRLAGYGDAAADDLAAAIFAIDGMPDVAPLLSRLADFSVHAKSREKSA